jgi:hypothetical protein
MCIIGKKLATYAHLLFNEEVGEDEWKRCGFF